MTVTINEIDDYINDTNNQINLLIDKENKINIIENTLENQQANSINNKDLLDQYNKENNEFKQNKITIQKRLHTNDRKIYYENNETKKLIFYKLLLSYIFWFFLGILLVILLYKGKIVNVYFIISTGLLLLFYYFGEYLLRFLISVFNILIDYFKPYGY